MAIPKSPTPARWYRHFFDRQTVLKTTWKLRLLVILVLLAIVVLPRSFWARQIAQSLVCTEQIDSSDALLVENFDFNYAVFDRAASLQKAGIAPRAFVPIVAFNKKASGLDELSKQFLEIAASTVKLEKFDRIPIGEREPISQNAAKQIRNILNKEHIKSVVVVAPGFRSRRSKMIYDAELGREGIRVGCAPVFGSINPETWTTTWHGMQQVTEQFLKLQYYRFYVLR